MCATHSLFSDQFLSYSFILWRKNILSYLFVCFLTIFIYKTTPSPPYSLTQTHSDTLASPTKFQTWAEQALNKMQVSIDKEGRKVTTN